MSFALLCDGEAGLTYGTLAIGSKLLPILFPYSGTVPDGTSRGNVSTWEFHIPM